MVASRCGGNLSHKREVNPFSHCFSDLWHSGRTVPRPPRGGYIDGGRELEVSMVGNRAWQILFGRDIEVLKSLPISEVSRPEWIEAPVKGICSISSGGVVAPSERFTREEVSGRQNEDEALGLT
ncbi:hypothetical protein K0M31_010334 [Melipona bicolor]|uniref:Uncharacterized protein n=1 Tax=Melipona bicolor TaxID=60889 RepID=A0AA40FLT9_9HYME|nr:hypothetical protein K0M31_010334 [Melipona bicolor]